MEVGIKTAQLLMDPQRRDQLKKQMQERYPLIPDAVVVSCIDVTAAAFTRVAPEKLQTALRPGGMARVRPQLEGALVDVALRSGIVRNVPLLDGNDKRNLVEFLVGAALDRVLEDAQDVLAAPEARLEALEEQVKEVQRMMGPARLFWYRARHRTREISAAVALSTIGFWVYHQRSAPMVAKGVSILSSAMVQLSGVLSVSGKRLRSAFNFLSSVSIPALYMLKNKILR